MYGKEFEDADYMRGLMRGLSNKLFSYDDIISDKVFSNIAKSVDRTKMKVGKVTTSKAGRWSGSPYTVSAPAKNMGFYKQIGTEAIINLSYGLIRIEVNVREYRTQPSCYVTYSYNLPSFGRYDQLLYKNRIERSMSIDNDMSDAKIVAQLEKKIKSLVEATLKWRKENTGKYLENHGLIKDNNYCTWPMRDMYSDLEKMKLRVAITVQNAKDNPQQPNHVDMVALLDGFTRLQEMFYNQSRGQDKFDSPIHL